MVRNIKMSWSTRRWIRRHNRRHSTPTLAAVVIRQHERFVHLTDTQAPAVVLAVHGTAHCTCGQSRPAYVRRVYGIDPAQAPT